MIPSNKKSQGLSLNTIIIAAIVLIVLIVLWSIFTGRMGLFTQELVECRGKCETKTFCQHPNGVEDSQGTPDCNKPTDEQDDRYRVVSVDDKVCCILLEK